MVQRVAPAARTILPVVDVHYTPRAAVMLHHRLRGQGDDNQCASVALSHQRSDELRHLADSLGALNNERFHFLKLNLEVADCALHRSSPKIRRSSAMNGSTTLRGVKVPSLVPSNQTALGAVTSPNSVIFSLAALILALSSSRSLIARPATTSRLDTPRRLEGRQHQRASLFGAGPPLTLRATYFLLSHQVQRDASGNYHKQADQLDHVWPFLVA